MENSKHEMVPMLGVAVPAVPEQGLGVDVDVDVDTLANNPNHNLPVEDEDDEEEDNKNNDSDAEASGSKKITRESHDEAFWYKLCEAFKKFQEANPKKNCSQRAFLRSREALDVTGAPRECRSFSRYYKRYEMGELNPTSSRRRRRAVGYVEIEDRLSTYLRLRSDIFIRGDTQGATWAKLKQKCMKWGAKELKEFQAREEKAARQQDGAGDGGEAAIAAAIADSKDSNKDPEKKYTDFRASPGWLHKVLKRNDIDSKYLQSEMDSKEEQAAMEEWIPRFHQQMVDLNISGSCLYNCAQASLFYRQLPSTKQQRKYRKQHVPTDERISLMICTAADGTKVPLACVGKPKTPFQDPDDDDDDDEDDDDDDEEEETSNKKRSADEMEGGKKRKSKGGGKSDKKPNAKPPIDYFSNSRSWFDPSTTLRWIHNVFWPFHISQHGDVPCVLLMDHVPAHTDLDQVDYDKEMPSNLKIIYFPVNMSRKRHPSEGGIVGSIRLGYKLKMASSVLALFDLFGGFQGAQERYYGPNGDQHERGTGGLACGDPATLLDALFILKQVWASNNRFVTTSLILEGWKKAKLLPTWWEEEIDMWIRNGAAPRARRKEGWSDHDCVQLCHALQSLATKADESGVDTSQLETTALRGSFVLTQREIDTFRPERDEDIWAMASAWIEIEDDPTVREHVLEYECDQVLATKKHAVALQNQLKSDYNKSQEDLLTTRFERVQLNLNDAKEYASLLGMDDKVVHLLDRFGSKLTQVVTKIQRSRNGEGRSRKKRAKTDSLENAADV